MSYCFNLDCKQPFHSFLDIREITYQTRCPMCDMPLLLRPHLKGEKSYRGIQLIGEGGFGKVIEVEDETGKQLVLKSLRFSQFSWWTNQKINSFFKREIQILSQLNDPGIPKVEPNGYFIWPEKSRKPSMYGLVMEKIEGINLEKWLSDESNWPIPQDQVIDWLEQLTKILEVVHQENYIHRDIKPSNIMKRSDGTLVLIDFGAARELTETYYQKFQSTTPNTVVFNSYGYTPEEQQNGRAVPQSDFFALGRTFVHIITGKYPMSILLNDQGQLDWRSYKTDIFPPFANLIDELIEPDFRNRPKNAKSILNRLCLIKEEIRQNSLPVISPKVKEFRRMDRRYTSEKSQEYFEKIPFQIKSEIIDAMGEAGEREIVDSIIHNRRINFESFRKRITEVGLQKTLLQIRKEIIKTVSEPKKHSNSYRRATHSPRHQTISSWYIIILILILTTVIARQVGDHSGINKFIPATNKLPNKEQKEQNEKILYPANSNKNLHTLDDNPVDISTPNIYDQTQLIPPFSNGTVVDSVKVSLDGKFIAIDYSDNTIRIYFIDTKELIQTIKSKRLIDFSPDSQTIVTVTEKQTVELWSIETGNLKQSFSKEK